MNAGNYSLRTRNPEFFDGTFVEGTTNFRITAKGGIEVDSNKAMPNLNLINDQVDRYLPNQTSFIISPLTTAEYFFNRNLNKASSIKALPKGGFTVSSPLLKDHTKVHLN